jgi:CheY-like chemotaxis protein
MEAVGRLAGGIAHDFNNLLTVILGFGNLTLKGLPAGDPLRGKVQQVVRAGERAAALTRQLLVFSRKQVLQAKVLDLGAVAEELEKMLRRMIGEDIELATVVPADLGLVKADPSQLEQVLLNLVINARDAMPEGGKLTIELSNAALPPVAGTPGPLLSAVLLAVTDTGVGMDAEVRSHIFEPFFTTKEQGKGTGLGLSTVYGIVQQSGGQVAVYSEPGHGTCFKVYLPRVDEPVEAAAPAAEVPLPRGTETILLVEDEEGVRDLARETLAAQGYLVLEAASAREALETAGLRYGSLDLVLTDVVLPGMSGPALVAELAARGLDSRVLFMSGFPDRAVLRHGVLELGTAFLAKPFTPDELARKVRAVLDASAGEEDDPAVPDQEAA